MKNGLMILKDGRNTFRLGRSGWIVSTGIFLGSGN
jgi:hypothetical protein